MAQNRNLTIRALMLGTGISALTACAPLDDFDLRGLGNGGLDTTPALQSRTSNLPQTDDRGVISYPNYQVALARRGDTVVQVANRVGLPPDEVARYNGLPTGTRLREGEVIALPSRVAEPSTATATGPGQASGQIDVTTIAGQAIDRAGEQSSAPISSGTIQNANEPVRHQVARGETAYSIARRYNVSVSALADWNSLGSDLTVREGQFLLIPAAAATPTAARQQVAVPPPGSGSPTPVPPSATAPLPERDETPARTQSTPPSPNMGDQRTAASGTSKLLMPINGRIIRPYEKRKNDGIDIGASAGTPVKAAADGTVAAITRDTDQVPILVLRHADNLLTVYAGVEGVTAKKGDSVKRGQTIAKVRPGDPSFVHFEVRQGFDSVDPMPYLN